MLRAVSPAVTQIIPFVVIFILFSAVSLFAKRSTRRLRDSLEVRDGRVVLKEEIRLKLERHPERLRRVEALVAKTYTVNERGEIVSRSSPSSSENVPWYKREISIGEKEPKPTAAPTPPPIPASGEDEKERFHSAWDEQDASPSIWDKDEKAAFWDDEKPK